MLLVIELPINSHQVTYSKIEPNPTMHAGTNVI